ncbi:acyl-CoA synthetases /AMP-acid ligases 2 [Coccidioides immitis RMSCC 3703]|uniref:Acyl-CoA synthetases /AMP-acid ligases 2 n=1 Tax=Coccidioides immitis RMSCC 3703 TaxID=454286 RepID=A0A0J8U242_COCIT|nr:acyl-CoA synthetases /AMP-acid ligases 2 [Coccidioides immitis RMSCC 3703]
MQHEVPRALSRPRNKYRTADSGYPSDGLQREERAFISAGTHRQEYRSIGGGFRLRTRYTDMEFDRTSFIPPHEGDTILPLSPFFSRLVRHAHRKPPRLAVRDVNLGFEKTYTQFLTDVLALRNTLRASLGEKATRDLKEGKEVYVGLLAAGGYEYAVGFVAIVALGAAVVPITLLLPVREASYFVLKARCVAVLASAAGRNLGDSLSQHIKAEKTLDVCCIAIATSFQPVPLAPEEICLSTGRCSDERAFLHDCSEEINSHFNITELDVILHVLPVHHATGVGINFLPYIFAGACVEFRSGGVDIPWLWERWKQGGVSVFSGVPTIYLRMMRYYEQRLALLPEQEVNMYIKGARSLRILLCGTSALPEPVQNFWSGVLGGNSRILTRYGSTEAGAIFRTPLDCEDVPAGSVGHLAPGVTIKLSNGDEGEILVKSPWMFAKYLHDPTATAAAHDAEGFFKTGDIARREGRNYFIMGRSSIDILKSGGYKISALDIEREVLSLPYIGEVMVVGVDDDEYGQRIAAAVTLRDDEKIYRCRGNGNAGKKLTIYDLRRDLRSRLAGYKMPTILRVVEGELSKSATGKVVKKLEVKSTTVA